MTTYAASTDVQARIPGRTISASTSPSTTQVTAYITEGEAMLTGALKGAQISTPITDSDGEAIMKAWAVDYAEGRCRQAWASAGGDGANDDGQQLLDNFKALLDDIAKFPQKYEAMLTGGAATNSRYCRSYVLDNEDDKTISDGDFDPVFEADEVF